MIEQNTLTKKAYIVNFATKWNVGYGKAVYLLGNTAQLGNWQIEHSHRLTYINNNIWMATLSFEKQRQLSQIQYKYFISNYNGQLNKNDIQWQQIQQNHKLSLAFKQNHALTICSFNIRFLNDNDKGQNHWNIRRQKIVPYLHNKFYDFIGIQQATYPQRQYLYSNLYKKYDYYGKARDLGKGQQCGILVNKQKYIVIEDYYDWISESRIQGSIGYDAKLPRYFTTLLVTPKITIKQRQKQQGESKQKKQQTLPCYLIINVHLDYMGKIAKKKGIQQMLEKSIKIKQQLFNQKCYKLIGCVIMGDFNISQGSPQLNMFKNNTAMKYKSMREIENSSKSITFNGFQNKYMLKLGQIFVDNMLTIDHMFYWGNQNVDNMNGKDKMNECLESIKFEVDKQQNLSDHYPIIGYFMI